MHVLQSIALPRPSPVTSSTTNPLLQLRPSNSGPTVEIMLLSNLPFQIPVKATSFPPSPSDYHTVFSERHVRATNACDACRQQRRQCDKGNPCTQCQSKGIICLYTDSPSTFAMGGSLNDGSAPGLKLGDDGEGAGGSPRGKTKAGNERKRLPLACLACRRKKIRCSGEKPACTHCLRSRILCEYKVTAAKGNTNEPKTDAVLRQKSDLQSVEQLGQISSTPQEMNAFNPVYAQQQFNTSLTTIISSSQQIDMSPFSNLSADPYNTIFWNLRPTGLGGRGFFEPLTPRDDIGLGVSTPVDLGMRGHHGPHSTIPQSLITTVEEAPVTDLDDRPAYSTETYNTRASAMLYENSNIPAQTADPETENQNSSLLSYTEIVPGDQFEQQLVQAANDDTFINPSYIQNITCIPKRRQKGPGYPCPVPGCERVGDREFTRHDYLTVHLRNVHGMNIPKRRQKGLGYPCPVPGCERVGEKEFMQSNYLTNHLRNVHGMNIPKRRQKGPGYPCPVPGCERVGDREFPRDYNLTVHLRNVHRIPKHRQGEAQ